jgi:uncharacterized membrane protein
MSRIESLLAALRRRSGLDADPVAVAVRVVYAGVAAYVALFLFTVVVHYLAFRSARFDLGDMVQPIWNTLHGRLLETTVLNGDQSSRLGLHVDPFLLLFVPLFWISSSPLLLLVVQVLAVSSGAFPVFWLARKHLRSARAGAHFAFAFLLYPATQFNALGGSDFHPVSIGVPLVLYAIWFLDEDRLLAFSAVALLAFTTKEEIPLAVGCLGIWYAVRKGRRLFGLGVFGAGLAVTVFDFLWVIPYFSPTGVNPFLRRYSAVGETPLGAAHKLVTDPLSFVQAVATGHKGLYVALLLVPFLGLWLLEPLVFLGALPDLAINLLASRPEQTSITFQGTAGIVPFVVAASIYGSARFRGQDSSVSVWVLAAVAAVAVFSPVWYLKTDVQILGSPLRAATAHAIDLVPRDVPVSATNRLGGYLSERRYIYTFPYVGRSRWIVADVNDPSPYWNNTILRRQLRSYQSELDWRAVFSSHGIVVLHKVRR